ncbi:hypothetical protein GCM10023063_39160 [Arthrobacter methylotrophus]|uniref:hypothetical protein n=1 Tax=Arthrobacter methylotrophus TaxID=121291 RepID=UPI0031ED9B72
MGDVYSPRTINQNLSVLSAFYDFHRRALSGPLRDPVTERLVDRGRFGAHHNPENEYKPGRRADYRQKVPVQAPRSIPDKAFEDLFAALGTDRDRALVAFYVSSAGRPSELVGLTNGMVDVGQLHDFRRAAASRMARDLTVSLTDVHVDTEPFLRPTFGLPVAMMCRFGVACGLIKDPPIR